MSTLATKIELPQIIDISVSDDSLTVELSDGRTISVPTAWYPRLLHATPRERKNWRLIGQGHGVHWEALDEDISVENLLAGKPSGESAASLKKWMENRVQGTKSYM